MSSTQRPQINHGRNLEVHRARRPAQTGSGPGWPLVGRDDEVRRALAALDTSARVRGVVLVGDSGTGKSTLARALAKAVESRGLAVRFALGTETSKAVPLGAFYWLLALDTAQHPTAMVAGAQRRLEQKKDLCLVVDDAQLLDPLSATLVHQLAVSGSTWLIVVIRSGEAVPDAVTALWKEQLLLRLDINAFTRAQTEVLACAVLGGAVHSQLIDELYDLTGGNLLLMRGVLSASRESGVLARTDAGWQCHGQLRGDEELYDLLGFRLRSLAPEEVEAIELLAAAEVLDWDILRMVSDVDTVARLERRGLIQFLSEGSHSIARLSHPVIGDAVLRQAGALRLRQLNGILAQQFQKQLESDEQHSRRSDVRTRIELAQFMVRSDLAPDLDVIIGAAASAVEMSSLPLGEELARFAFDRGGGLPAALVLAQALSWQGRGEEAEAVLAGAGLDGAGEWLITQWGCSRAANLFWVCGQVEPARQLLASVKRRVVPGTDPSLIIEALEVSFCFFAGDVATTIETGPSLCASEVLPSARLWAVPATSGALAAAGRFGDVHQVASAGGTNVPDQMGPHRFAIGMIEVVAATAAGDIPAAERVWERHAATAAGVPAAEAMVAAMRGLVQVARGALPSACAAFRDSMSALSQGFPSPWLVAVAAQHAQAEGTRGDSAAAAAAVRSAEQAYGPQVAVFLPELELARAWERAAAGQPTAARTHSALAAQIARDSGMHAVEMRALHTAVRFGDRLLASRLEKLSRTVNTPLAEAIATQARGLASHDGDLLDAAAGRFADLGALALAADATAQAASEHACGGHRGKEVESSIRAYRLARQCELHTPAVDAAARPLPASDREREIAMLVEAGLSNRQIADRLVVSVRTVEGHIYRIFAKLGIASREQLIGLLRLERTES